MVIMTLELWYIHKYCIIEAAYFPFASVNFLKISEMTDFVVDYTYAKNEGRL